MNENQHVELEAMKERLNEGGFPTDRTMVLFPLDRGENPKEFMELLGEAYQIAMSDKLDAFELDEDGRIKRLYEIGCRLYELGGDDLVLQAINSLKEFGKEFLDSVKIWGSFVGIGTWESNLGWDNFNTQYSDVGVYIVTCLAVDKLKSVAEEEGFIGGEPGEVFDESGHSRRAVAIGEALNALGGWGLMNFVFRLASPKIGKIESRKLEFAWGSIGVWRG